LPPWVGRQTQVDQRSALSAVVRLVQAHAVQAQGGWTKWQHKQHSNVSLARPQVPLTSSGGPHRGFKAQNPLVGGPSRSVQPSHSMMCSTPLNRHVGARLNGQIQVGDFSGVGAAWVAATPMGRALPLCLLLTGLNRTACKAVLLPTMSYVREPHRHNRVWR
jgi:hypothetical protein